MERLWVGFGAIAGLSMVAMAAYAAHGLTGTPPATLASVANAVQMQAIHALALVFTGLWARRGGILAHLAGAAFVVGILLFCGAVYQPLVPAWVQIPRIAFLAPFGGMALMAGWALLCLSALRR